MNEELQNQLSLLDGIDLSSSMAPQMPVQPVQQQVTQDITKVQPVISQQTTGVNLQTSQTVASKVTPANNIQAVQTAPMMDVNEIKPVSMPAIKTRKLGQPAYVNLIEKAKADPGQGIRLALFTMDCIPWYTHFVSGKGYIACLSERDDETGMVVNTAPCCLLKNDGELAPAKTKFIIPVIEMVTMPNDKSYNIIPNTPCKLKVLVIGAKEYNQLNDLYEANSNIGSYDIIAKTANDQWKTINFAPTAMTARTQIPNFQQEVEKWNDPKIKEAAVNLAGRVLKPEIIQRIVEEQSVVPQEVVIPDVNGFNI